MKHPDRFPYVHKPPEGWRSAIIKAVREDLPTIPSVSLKSLGSLAQGSIFWLIYVSLTALLIVMALWLGGAGFQAIDRLSEYLWPVFAALPIVIIAAGITLRTYFTLRTHILPKTTLVADDAPSNEKQLLKSRCE